MWQMFRRREHPCRRVLIGMCEIGTINIALFRSLRRLGVRVDSLTWVEHAFEISSSAAAARCVHPGMLGQVLKRANAVRAALFPRQVDSTGLQGLWRFEHAPVRLLSALRALIVYDTFVFVHGETLLPLNLDLPLLRMLNKRVAVIFNGCDIRARAAVLPLHRPFTYCSACSLPCVARDKERRARRAAQFANVVYAMPEYAQYLRRYRFLWLPIDLAKWPPRRCANPLPVVVHAPSNSALKGTVHVEAAVQRLRDEGYEFDYVCLQRKPHAEVRRAMERADIVVDQLLYGWYGLLAIEAMALEKCVVTYVSEECRRTHEPYDDLPLLNADPTTIYDVLRRAILEPELRTALAVRARAFVERYHDADRVATALLADLERA